MIKEIKITDTLELVEFDDVIHIRIKNYETNTIIAAILNQIEAIHLRNDISIWANNKRNRDLRKEKK